MIDRIIILQQGKVSLRGQCVKEDLESSESIDGVPHLLYPQSHFGERFGNMKKSLIVIAGLTLFAEKLR